MNDTNKNSSLSLMSKSTPVKWYVILKNILLLKGGEGKSNSVPIIYLKNIRINWK